MASKEQVGKVVQFDLKAIGGGLQVILLFGVIEKPQEIQIFWYGPTQLGRHPAQTVKPTQIGQIERYDRRFGLPGQAGDIARQGREVRVVDLEGGP